MALSAELKLLKTTYKVWNDTKGEGGTASESWLQLFDENFRLLSIGDEVQGLAFAMPRSSKQQALDYLTDLLKDGKWSAGHLKPMCVRATRLPCSDAAFGSIVGRTSKRHAG